MNMRAVVKREVGPGLSLERIPVPTPAPDEVLIRVKATAICGTDLHIVHWNSWAQQAGIQLPLVLGHEFSGEVAAIGDRVQGLKPGDYVAGETHIPCGACFQCQNGLQHICGRMRLFGIHRNGSFAEYTTLPELCARRIPAALPPRFGAVLEPLGTSLRAALELVLTGERVVVIGCGPIGLFAVAAARATGAATVFALDVVEDRLDLARKIGADVTLNAARVDVAAEILQATDGVGVDAIIEASGSAPAVELAFRYLRKGGKVALVGLPSAPVSLNLGPDLIFKEAKVIGIHGREMFRTWTTMEQMLVRGQLAIEPVFTHELPMEEVEEGLRLLEAGKGSKIILAP